ncbi:MAG TPA: anthranilate synthase component I family protein [Actinomycetota bacterium]|nr:anthranilate synthase component I family protein [Actinomycetota bacterium]
MASTTAIHTDLVTPLGAYLGLRGLGPSFLMESVERGRLRRYSLVGWGRRVVPLEEAERLVAAGTAVVGYLAYDHVVRLEPVPLPAEGPAHPESAFVAVEGLLRFDHAAGVAEVLAGDRQEMAGRLADRHEIAGRLANLHETVGRPHGLPPSPTPSAPPSRGARLRRFPSRRTYEGWVRRAKEHIRAGDCYQVVLSQRAERPTSLSPVALYRSLRRVNPSPYMFLLELDGLALVGSSPETLVRLDGTRASVNPIAGTIPRGEGDADRLLASEKDRAEHVMLVDLGRNDLSRVCLPGTVRVERFLEPERYSHVTHLVSEVSGELRPRVGPFDLLRACFPAGTVSGAPKVRAMQLISEIEGYRRGIYAGAVGYALPDGTFDTCIAIRTMVVAGGVTYLQAGAGIVADSDPAAEHRECLGKLAALEAAIEEAEAQ